MGWNVAGLLQTAAGYLADRGAESARLDAEVLLAAVLERTRLDLIVAHDMPVNDAQRARYRALVRRRGQGEPTAYLLGVREFHSLEFTVDARCLVPRPETEHLVDEGLRWLEDRREGGGDRGIVVDLGTGSGCIVVTLAHRFPEAEYHAVDLSADALDVAEENRRRLAPDAPIAFHRGDLYEALPADLRADLIVSNPPYITEAEMAELMPTVREFEPRSALCSGADPIAFHRRIIDGAVAGRLGPGGAVLLELGESGADALAPWLGARHPGLGVRFIRDYRGVRRVAVVSARD